MYHYLTVDGYFHGTGIRDSVEGGFVELELLAISPDLKDRIKKWVLQYEAEHYNHYAEEKILKTCQKEESLKILIEEILQIKKENIEKLDIEGKEIAILLKKELIHVKVKYYSAANSKKELV